MSRLVSIVLPTYNGSRFIRQSVDSVLGQTYRNLQLIVVDDRSSDDTAGIVDGYAAADDRVTVIHNSRNLKLPRSLNAGFAAATGEYLTWTSDDNWYEPTAIERMAEYLDGHPDVGMAVADFRKLQDDEVLVSDIRVEPPDLVRSAIGACFLYRSSVAAEVGEYNPDCFLAEDYEYWLRMGLVTKFGKIGEVLYNYRVHPNSLSGSRMAEIVTAHTRVKERFIGEYLRKFGRSSLADVEAELAWARLRDRRIAADVPLLKAFYGPEELAVMLKKQFRQTGDAFFLDVAAGLGPFQRMKARWWKLRYGAESRRRSAGSAEAS